MSSGLTWHSLEWSFLLGWSISLCQADSARLSLSKKRGPRLGSDLDPSCCAGMALLPLPALAHHAACTFTDSQPLLRLVSTWCLVSHPLPTHCDLGPTHHLPVVHPGPVMSSSCSTTTWWPMQLLAQFCPPTADIGVHPSPASFPA